MDRQAGNTMVAKRPRPFERKRPARPAGGASGTRAAEVSERAEPGARADAEPSPEIAVDGRW